MKGTAASRVKFSPMYVHIMSPVGRGQTNGLNQTYDTAICTLKCNNIAKLSKGAIMNKRNAIKPKYFRQLNDALINHIIENKAGDAKIKVVDGTYIYLPKKFTKYGFHLTAAKRRVIIENAAPPCGR